MREFIRLKSVISLLIIVLALPVMAARTYSVDDMPNPADKEGWNFVSDPAGILSPAAVGHINATAKRLIDNYSVELAVAVAPSIGDASIEDFSTDLFRKWGVGKKDKDNGVLLVLVPEDRVVRIETGYGTEGVLTDVACSRIIRNNIVPAMQNGDVDAAVTGAVDAIAKRMENPTAQEILRSGQKTKTKGAVSKDSFYYLVFIIMGCCFLLAVWLFIRDCRKTRGLSNYARSLRFRSHRYDYLLLAIVSGLAALPIYIAVLLMIRYYRNKPLLCDTCGAKMEKLPEDKDNELLSPQQDLEERLNTVDYDVWVCPDCGTIERLPYKVDQKKYKECPQCHTLAYGEVMDKILVPATNRQQGQGVKVYECAYCGNHKERHYKIPRKENDAALIAGLAAGAMLGSRRGGGGFGGGGFGGFGGGMSGGGGATGRW